MEMMQLCRIALIKLRDERDTALDAPHEVFIRASINIPAHIGRESRIQCARCGPKSFSELFVSYRPDIGDE